MFFMRSGDKPQRTDEELLQLYHQKGDQQYAAELFQRYTHLIFGICMKYFKDEEAAKDATMGIYEKLLKELQKFEVGNFRSWLYALTKNYCLMQLRSAKAEQKRMDGYENFAREFMEDGELLHLDGTDEHELMEQALGNALQELKMEQKWCIELFYLQNKSYQEVTEITGYSMKQVKSYLQNGKRNLKIRLGERNE